MTDLPEHPGPQIVVAVGHKEAIGQGGTLPWEAPEDLAHFRELTMGHHLVVGATTWASIGRPLPGRHIIVVSHRALELPRGIQLAGSPAAALTLAEEVDPSPYIAGGAAIYQALLPKVVRIHRTDIAVDVPDADTVFPATKAAQWKEVASTKGDDKRLTFRVLDRK